MPPLRPPLTPQNTPARAGSRAAFGEPASSDFDNLGRLAARPALSPRNNSTADSANVICSWSTMHSAFEAHT